MRKTPILALILALLIIGRIQAQNDIQIGSDNSNRATNGGFFDYSDPSGINIKVQIWGYVRYAGYYIVPAGTNINELISLAGGPTEDALLDDIRLIKIESGSKTIMLKYNYNDFLWEDEINTSIKYKTLDAGDIISVPGKPRYFVRQDIAFYLGILTALASTAALIVSIIAITK